MHLAASAGHASSVLEMTRERRTNISATDHQGWTPLHMACRWNHVLVAGVLINNSRTLIASRTRHGWTPFQLAFEEGNDRIVRMLVEQERAVLAHRMRLASESATRHAATPLASVRHVREQHDAHYPGRGRQLVPARVAHHGVLQACVLHTGRTSRLCHTLRAN